MTQAVAAGDRALALGLTRQELGACLSAMEHWPGVRAARRVVGFLDVRAESVGEVGEPRTANGGRAASAGAST